MPEGIPGTFRLHEVAGQSPATDKRANRHTSAGVSRVARGTDSSPTTKRPVEHSHELHALFERQGCRVDVGERIADIIRRELTNEQGTYVTHHTGPPHAKIQNELLEHLLEKLSSGPRVSLEKCFHEVQIATLHALHGQCAESAREAFCPEQLKGVESAFAYVVVRKDQLEQECARMYEGSGAPKGTFQYRILLSDTLDARWAIDALELIYGLDSNGEPCVVHECNLVQVKSSFYEGEVEKSLKTHAGFVEHLTREPHDLFPRQSVEALRASTGSMQALDTVCGLLCPPQEREDLSTEIEEVWNLVVAEAPTGDVRETYAYYDAIGSIVGKTLQELVATEDAELARDFYQAIYSRVEGARAQCTLDTTDHTSVGPQKRELALPEHIGSHLYVKGVCASASVVPARDEKGAVPRIMFVPKRPHDTRKERGGRAQQKS